MYDLKTKNQVGQRQKIHLESKKNGEGKKYSNSKIKVKKDIKTSNV